MVNRRTIMKLRDLFICFFSMFFLTAVIKAEDMRVLTLEDCIELGVKNNFQIKKSNYDLFSAREAIKQVKSQYEPQINCRLGRTEVKNQGMEAMSVEKIEKDMLSIGLNKKFYSSGGLLSLTWENEKSDNNYTSGNFSGLANPSYDSDMTLAYSQPLISNFAGNNDKKYIQISKFGEGIAELSLRAQENILLNKIENAYFDLNFYGRNLKIQKVFLKRSKKLLSINKKKMKDGLLEEVDIIATEASVTLREASILLAKDYVQNAKDKLKNIIGLPQENNYSFATEDFADFKHQELNKEEVIKTALLERPDLKIIENNIKINLLTTKIKRNEKLPSLALDGQYGVSGYGEDWSDDYNSLEPSWYVGLNLVFFPFNKQSNSLINQSEYAYKKNITELSEQKFAIITDCRSICRRINTQALYVQAVYKSLKLQKKKLKLEEIKFNQGRSSIQWILNFQDDLNRSEIEYYQALTDYYKAKADLKVITGVNK